MDRVGDLNTLHRSIVDAAQIVSPGMISNVKREFFDRLGYCLAQAGELYEHLLH